MNQTKYYSQMILFNLLLTLHHDRFWGNTQTKLQAIVNAPSCNTGNALQKGIQLSKPKQQTSVYYICFNTEKYDTFVFKTAKCDTWSIFFDQVSYFFHIKIRPSVAFGRFFRPVVVFDLHICYGCSKELSQWDCNLQHPKHMFKLMGKKIQVNLAMSNLLISNTRHMSKWSSIPEQFPYIALYFKHVYVELGYHEISAISKWFFILEN